MNQKECRPPNLRRIACIGGGPGGLYFALLMKLAVPEVEITVYERETGNSKPGWGLVLPDEALTCLAEGDPWLAECVAAACVGWDRIEMRMGDQSQSVTMERLRAIPRKILMRLLRDRAVEIGVIIRDGITITDTASFQNADLIVAADGAASLVRARHAAHFGTEIIHGANRYLWMGSDAALASLAFYFIDTEFGWFHAHAYPHGPGQSTIILEAPTGNWQAAGFDALPPEGRASFCRSLLGAWLGSPQLHSRDWQCRHFCEISNSRWEKDNLVLLGDAAHTTHFSIGSGTRLAFADARALVRHLTAFGNGAEALLGYQQERQTALYKLQSAARNSAGWFEHVESRAQLPARQFFYSLLTRSLRVGHRELARQDPDFVEAVETDLSGSTAKVSPMFQPLQLRDLTLINRVVVSPMAMYSAIDGVPGDFHLVHLGARAMGGAGLIMTEMTAPAPDGRITPCCPGIYSAAQIEAWRRITDFVHANSPAKICLQLGHAGPKGATRRGWEGMHEPLTAGGWPLIAPSPIAWNTGSAMPRQMDPHDRLRVTEEFANAAFRADEAGFDMIEIHAAHGYLLSAFLSPLRNRRDDAYGGCLENRLRFPLEVFSAVRRAWPSHKPVSVRISATDWGAGGTTIEDAITIARAFRAAGADLIDVSSGQTTPDAQPRYGRLYQAPFAERIRNEAGIATMAVGNITSADQINGLIAAGRADLCALARPHLSDPNFTLRAAAELGHAEQAWPLPYLAARPQLETLLAKTA